MINQRILIQKTCKMVIKMIVVLFFINNRNNSKIIMNLVFRINNLDEKNE